MVGDADGSAHLELRLSARIGLSGQQRRRRLQAELSHSQITPRPTAVTNFRHSMARVLMAEEKPKVLPQHLTKLLR